MSLRARDVTIRQQDGFDERNCGRQISMPSQRYFPFRRKGVVKRIPHQPPMNLEHLCNSPDASHSPPVFASYLCIQIDLAFHIHLDFPVGPVNSGALACSPVPWGELCGLGASGFEPPTSWSRTMNTNPINDLSGVAYGTRSLVSPLLVVRSLSVAQRL